MALGDPIERDQEVQDLAEWFESSHLPPTQQAISKACANVAQVMVAAFPDSPELIAGLRKLLEAKDCFVRASIKAQGFEEIELEADPRKIEGNCGLCGESMGDSPFKYHVICPVQEAAARAEHERDFDG